MHIPDSITTPTRVARHIVLGLLILSQALAAPAVSLRVRGRNLDDVWNVELWGSWRPFTAPILLPRDTFVLHAPINVLSRLIFGEGNLSLTVATMVLNAIGFALVLHFVGFVGHRSLATAGQVFWLQVTIGLLYAFISLQMLHLLGRPDYRNVEVGLFLLAIELTVRSAERNRLTGSSAGVCLALGLIAFNDPMFLICGLASWLVVLGVRWLTSQDTAAERRAAIVLAGGVVAFGLFRVLFGLAGVQISNYAAPGFADFTDLPRALTQTLQFFLVNFGASFSDLPLEDARTIFQLVRLGLLAVVLLGVWKFRTQVPDGLRAPLVAVAVPVVSLFLASTFSTIGSFEGQNTRYMVPADGLVIVLAVVPLAFGTRRYRTVMALWIVFVAGVVGFDVVRYGRGVMAHGADSQEFDALGELADALELSSATVGYAPTFVAIPTEYFADSSIKIASVECDPTGTPVIGTFSNLAVPTATTDRSFYVLWEVDTSQCTRQQVIDAVGEPVDETQYDFGRGDIGRFRVLWFNGNIGSHLDVID